MRSPFNIRLLLRNCSALPGSSKISLIVSLVTAAVLNALRTDNMILGFRTANRPFEVMLYFSEYRVNQALADH
jgi:hypothetical protein